MRRRILNAGGAGILALLLLPLLGVASAQAQAGQITEFKVTQGGIDGGPLTLGADGDLYFGTGFPATIGRITSSGQVTQFADPNTVATNIGLTAAGPDGNVWFADSALNTQGELGRVTPAGQITMFTIPMFDGERTALAGLAAGPDGNLWFTADAVEGRATVTASLVGKVNPATGAITEFAIPSGASDPGPITVGSDGNLWFSEVNLPGVARVTPSGQITEFKVTQGGIDGGPLTLGADGDLYFGTGFPATIGRITSSGQVTQFADPNTVATNIGLTAAGPDGNVWFADSALNTQGELGRVTPAGQITMFTIPMFDGLRTLLEGLVAGPDGNLWFTADAFTARTVTASLVGKVDPATGAITEFAIPSGASDPGPITVGSDGNLWFSEVNLPGVARVTTH